LKKDSFDLVASEIPQYAETVAIRRAEMCLRICYAFGIATRVTSPEVILALVRFYSLRARIAFAI
jgi:hypothetical protein